MLKVILLTLFAANCCYSLTVIELVRLYFNDYNTISNTSAFTIQVTDDDTYTIIISGDPQHETSECYKAQVDCCRPGVVNRPRERSIVIPRNPVATESTYCTPMGLIGVTTGGTAVYNHFEANCVDVNEFIEGSMDECNGHFSPNGEYHFHLAPNPACVGNVDQSEAHIIGVALDGFPIYDSAFFNGEEEDLDECGGFMPLNDPTRYRYVAKYSPTDTTDHILPCFRGVPLNATCCECRECNREQIPNCRMRERPQRGRPQFSGAGNGQGGGPGLGRPQGFRPGFGPPQGFRPGRGSPQGFRPGNGPPQGFRPGGGFPQGGRPVGAGRPNAQFPGGFEETRPGFCTRDQVRQQLNPPDCSSCPRMENDCIPPGGYKDFEEARKMAACRSICGSLTSQQISFLQRLRDSLG